MKFLKQNGESKYLKQSKLYIKKEQGIYFLTEELYFYTSVVALCSTFASP